MTDTHTTTPTTTQESDAPSFSAELWAAWWAAPDLSAGIEDILADDILGYWPGDHEPVQGLDKYVAKIADLLDAYPDLRLELIDSATIPGATPGEQLVFLHYVGHGTGPAGQFQIRGLDRVRTLNGIVIENVIRYDPAEFPGRPGAGA